MRHIFYIQSMKHFKKERKNGKCQKWGKCQDSRKYFKCNLLSLVTNLVQN